MIADLKPYPAMKDSGVPWLGEVPRHWEVQRLKNVARLIMGQSPASDDCSAQRIGLPFLQGCAEFGSDHPRPKQFCRAPAKVSPEGAILISVRAPVGRLNFADQPYGIGRGLCAVVPITRLNPAFSGYALGASTHGLVLLSTGSTYDAVSVGDVAGQPVLLPPLPEQAAIVRFLDHADRRIRRYIRAKQKLISLLEEQKQAIIHRAVTRGLDPNVRLKPSGIAWLGDIPHHWEVVRSGSMFRLFGGYAFPGSGFLRDESDATLPLLLTPVNFDPEGGLRFGSNSTVRFRGEIPGRFRLRKGDLVTVLTDLSAKRLILGRAGFVSDDGVLLNQRTARVDIHASIRVRLSVGYLCLVLNSAPVREQTIETSRGSTVFHTSPTRMLAARWPLPPLEEQNAIVKKLETVAGEHRAACEKFRDEIALLGEYRTRLIADVVTGKVDVREAAARLPDEVDELEPVDEADAELEEDAVDNLDAAADEVEAS